MQNPNSKYQPLQPDCIYHVYNRANGKDKLFLCDENYNFFLKQYSLFIAPIAEAYSYCLMPNHFHLLLRIRTEPNLSAYFEGLERLRMLRKIKAAGFDEHFIPESKRGPDGFTPQQIEKLLSQQFSDFFSSYTQAFNKVYMRMGSLFMKNFKRKEVTNELYMKTLVQYIHLNPVETKLCDEPRDWAFSSYNAVLANDSSIINVARILELFEDTDNFRYTHSSLPAVV